MIVGLTGGIGSGKTTVAKMFHELGVSIYIADIEAKKLMHSSEALKSELITAFGEETYIDGALNRSYLSNIVFNKPEALQKINAIVHPKVGQQRGRPRRETAFSAQIPRPRLTMVISPQCFSHVHYQKGGLNRENTTE